MRVTTFSEEAGEAKRYCDFDTGAGKCSLATPQYTERWCRFHDGVMSERVRASLSNPTKITIQCETIDEAKTGAELIRLNRRVETAKVEIGRMARKIDSQRTQLRIMGEVLELAKSDRLAVLDQLKVMTDDRDEYRAERDRYYRVKVQMLELAGELAENASTKAVARRMRCILDGRAECKLCPSTFSAEANPSGLCPDCNPDVETKALGTFTI